MPHNSFWEENNSETCQRCNAVCLDGVKTKHTAAVARRVAPLQLVF
ncbi:MAG: hypothetical protein V2J65_24935 [Desulfobacteraceae bacterium]|nr:hypothetical protein [Desulfobacteraceae bacterium]